MVDGSAIRADIIIIIIIIIIMMMFIGDCHK